MESLDLITRIIGLICALLFISSVAIRFIYTSQKDSIATAVKDIIEFKFGFPISRSGLEDGSNAQIVIIINILLRLSYVLFVIIWPLIIILAIAESIWVCNWNIKTTSKSEQIQKLSLQNAQTLSRNPISGQPYDYSLSGIPWCYSTNTHWYK